MNIAVYGPSGGDSGPPFPTPTPAPTAWVRNPSWLPMPEVLASEQKVAMLVSVFPTEATTYAFRCQGAYTVDWGDGSAPENVATNTIVNHSYDFADVDLANTNAPVTLTDAGDLVGRVAHGYSNGDIVQFFNIASTTGLVDAQSYYVINKTDDAFQVSLSPGGSAVTLTTDGTATLLNYKQAMIVITPQAGQNITVFEPSIAPTSPAGYLQTNTIVYILDVLASLPNLVTHGAWNNTNYNLAAERIRYVSLGAITSVFKFFKQCRVLRTIEFPTGWAPHATANTASEMFQHCHALDSISLFGASNITNTSYMFMNCFRLRLLPDFNFSGAITVASAMFVMCSSLTSLSNVTINLSSCTSADSAFASCANLQYLPQAMDLSSCVNTNSMFAGCRNLLAVPAMSLTAAAGCNATGMFSGCSLLREISSLDTSKVTAAHQMFRDAVSLIKLPALDFSSITGSIFGFLQGACGLTELVITNIGAPTSLGEFANMNTATSALITVRIQGGTFANVTSAATMFNGCKSLRYLEMPTDFTATLTNTGSMFAATLLTNVPLFNTSGVTNAGSMFANMPNLTSIPMYNFAACENLSSVFSSCISLSAIPTLNTSANKDASSMFVSCSSLTSIPAISFSAVTTGKFSNTFQSTSLTSIKATGFNFSFSVASLRLSTAALDKIYTNLPVVVGQTITVSNNYGTTGDDPTIAQAKGWTVTG